MIWLLIGYLTVTVLWFAVSVLVWAVHKDIYEDKSQRAAWWATRAPLWPWYGLVGIHRGARALVFDAMKGKP